MPTQEQIFRRRRALAVIALALLVSLIWGIPQLFRGPASDVLVPDDSAQPIGNVAECAPGVVTIEVMIGRIIETAADGTQNKETLNSFGVETLPALWYKITNNSQSDCSFNVGPRVTFFTISSGDQTFWSSKDCNREGLEDAIVNLAAGQTLEAKASEWERSYSSQNGCNLEGNDAVPAAGATYKVRVEVNGVLSEEKRFILN
ncbi:MAG: hypothetical protein RL044_537 [Actinomycetota bacterium]